ncbi:MAG: glycosyltransferase family 4 protein [archaeon]
MRVLMFGWEFPPYFSGGLGTACYGMTKALSKLSVDVTFVIPKFLGDVKAKYVKLISSVSIKGLKILGIGSPLLPYVSSASYSSAVQYRYGNVMGGKMADMYGKDLFHDVLAYSKSARIIAQVEDFDVIHCHDWMTFQAGIEAKAVSGKKLIVQVHATEFDRTAGHPNQYIYDIEKAGMNAADRIIAVSNLTKGIIVEKYGIPPEKVEVVHNAVEIGLHRHHEFVIEKKDRIVLFLGRITIQKGPEYFIYAAKKVLEKKKDVKFIMAGPGDMLPRMIELTAQLGISDKIFFTGGVKGPEVDRLYRMADVFVMPSVSEPFGITPLESMIRDTPAIISRTSGVSEIVKHVLKVDFWDVNDLANKILCVLNYDVLRHSLKEHGRMEIEGITWLGAAKKIVNIYCAV